MKFSNVVAYCKGWYAKRGDVDTMWMDLAHCINVDGWSVFTKKDVANWCMHRIDDWKDDIPNLSYFNLIYDINDNKRRYDWYRNDGKTLSFEDAIIWTFYSYISAMDGNKFTEGVRPSNEVLPFRLNNACYYPNISNKYHFAEMMCDRLAEIERMFPDYPEQKLKEWYSFEKRESQLAGRDKHWENVLVRCGTDSLLDCKEVVVSGKTLNNSGNIKFDGEHYFDMNIYYHCKFDPDKEYIVRYAEEIHSRGEERERIEYVIKSIKEK